MFTIGKGGYERFFGFAMPVVKPEEAIILTVSSNNEISPPPKDTMNPEEMTGWLRELEANGCAMSAVDFAGQPRPINPNGDQ